MDDELLKTCQREIGHIVFDANEKISTRRISNTWSLDSKQSLEVLQKWVEGQKEPNKLSKEYVVRGVDKNGNVFITLANEEKLEKISKAYPKCSKMLYSVEVASDVRPLNVSNDNEFNVIRLRLESQKRQIEQASSSTAPQTTPKPTPAPVKQEQKPSKPSMFAAASKQQPPVKEEKQSPPAKAQVKPEPKTAASPPKASPKTQSPKKQDAKKAVTGKGSISSFFSAKPAGTAPKPAPTSVPVKQEPQSPAPEPAKKEQKDEKAVEKSVEKSRKRTITDDEEEEEEDRKKNPSNPSKKSRLLQICDSSSDEEADGREAGAAIEQRSERLVEFDEETPMETEIEENKKEEGRKPSLSPEKPVENDSNSVNRNRGKVKKLVTKTYTDEEGYLITVKDYEMVSEDDESTANGTEKEMAAPAAGAAAPTKPKASLASQGKSSSTEKKATPPTPKTKQGSIMSFFAKK
uniref:DNA polymerase delta subunit 3 n=1 Tax=Anopheles coluzzii TaxID=1518534 RepID=A0A8W7PEK4_ANOCL